MSEFKDGLKYYAPARLRERAAHCDTIAAKHAGDYRYTVEMEAWALRVAADIVEAAEVACRSSAVHLGFSDGDLSEDDQQEAAALAVQAFRAGILEQQKA